MNRDSGFGVRGGVALCALLAFASTAWAQKPADAKADSKAAEPKPVVIKPGKIHEKCMSVTSAQKLEYQFATTKPVDFNIHYHVGESIYYPVKRAKTTGEADRFQPTKGKEDYCLMWENKSSAEVELTFSAKVIK